MAVALFWRGIAVELVLCLGTTGELLVRGIELFWRGTLDELLVRTLAAAAKWLRKTSLAASWAWAPSPAKAMISKQASW